jgi:hypothetical protein
MDMTDNGLVGVRRETEAFGSGWSLVAGWN